MCLFNEHRLSSLHPEVSSFSKFNQRVKRIMTPEFVRESDVPTVPMSEVLARIADELRVLAWTSDNLQDAISPVVLANGGADKSSLSTLQSLDLISQSIAGIAQVVDALTRADASRGMVDPMAACRGLTLSALADRIAGQEGRSAFSAVADDQCDYFEDFGADPQENFQLHARTA